MVGDEMSKKSKVAAAGRSTDLSSQFSLSQAKKLDSKDPLKKFRKEFHFPKTKSGKQYLYFCGNSLGLQPKLTKKYIDEELKEWAKFGVEGHFHAKRPWLPYHEFVIESLANLVGAKPIEVTAMNSLTVNLHLLFASFYKPTAQRSLIMIEENSFPSDEYAVQSQADLHGYDPKTTILRAPNSTQKVIEMIEQHGEKIAVVWLGHVNYLTGYAFDLKKIADAAHRKGCMFGVDLAHGIGNLKLNLHDDGVDFATWCSYKYLNSGPGGISGIFVHEKHGTDTTRSRLSGWWGHNKKTRFEMGPEFEAISGAEGFQLSNPPIFQLAALRASLDLFDKAKITRLREKSVQLTGFLEMGLKELIPDLQILTPANPNERGTQLCLRIPKAPKELVKKLLAKGVICDFRSPDIVRVAPVPMYNSFQDVFEFVHIFKKILESS